MRYHKQIKLYEVGEMFKGIEVLNLNTGLQAARLKNAFKIENVLRDNVF